MEISMVPLLLLIQSHHLPPLSRAHLIAGQTDRRVRGEIDSIPTRVCGFAA